jgi:hypothetical protein
MTSGIRTPDEHRDGEAPGGVKSKRRRRLGKGDRRGDAIDNATRSRRTRDRRRDDAPARAPLTCRPIDA